MGGRDIIFPGRDVVGVNLEPRIDDGIYRDQISDTPKLGSEGAHVRMRGYRGVSSIFGMPVVSSAKAGG